jgi:hypothetical protein
MKALLLVAVLSMPMAGRCDIFFTAKQLYDYCQGGSAQSNFCGGYVTGVADMLQNQPDRICVPPDASAWQLTRLFMDYASARPDLLNLGAHNVISFALNQAFPCTPEQQ